MRRKYAIYDGKAAAGCEAVEGLAALTKGELAAIGRRPSFARGDYGDRHDAGYEKILKINIIKTKYRYASRRFIQKPKSSSTTAKSPPRSPTPQKMPATDRCWSQSSARRRRAGGLTHREALLLLDTRDEELTERMFAPGPPHQGAHLRQPHRHVRAALPVELLCERLRLPPLPPQEQAHPASQADAGGDPPRGDGAPGHGSQAPGARSGRGPAQQPAGVHPSNPSTPSTRSATATAPSAA